MRAFESKPAKWAALCILLLSGGARANPQPSPMPAQNILPANNAHASGGSDTDSSFDDLDVVDDSLKGKLAVLRVGSESSANNLLSVFAGLKNKTARRLNLEVQTIYKDQEGNALNAGSWIPMTLKPHEEREYRSTSITEQAVDFLIRVRRAHVPASAQGSS
jgi:hypothetical protein